MISKIFELLDTTVTLYFNDASAAWTLSHILQYAADAVFDNNSKQITQLCKALHNDVSSYENLFLEINPSTGLEYFDLNKAWDSTILNNLISHTSTGQLHATPILDHLTSCKSYSKTLNSDCWSVTLTYNTNGYETTNEFLDVTKEKTFDIEVCAILEITLEESDYLMLNIKYPDLFKFVKT